MAKLNLGVLASGGGSNFQAILDAIAAGELDARVVLLITNNSAAGAITRAHRDGVAIRHISTVTHPDPDALDAAVRDAMLEAGAQILCLAGYMKKIGPKTLAAFRGRILNIHPALLPKHGGPGCYGIHVHEKVLASGDAVTGVTIHVVDAVYDHGRILEQAEVPVIPGDTPEILQQRVLKEEHKIYPRVLRKIAEGGIVL
ncbi:MAG: phosphoribosylglycinamide formyltransferase [Candidatus Sumerlaeota bacterium]|nr:phosphoribosylglycinamide formyltransferase [Candidatus Sumerlaeota bacterium]